MPNIISAKYFKDQSYLITKYLNLNGYIVKSFIFYQKDDFKQEFSRLLFVSDGCFVLVLIPYCTILQYSAPLDN